MKKFLFMLSLAFTSSTFANTTTVYRFDDVDAVWTNGKTILIEDLRDGFATVKGVQVDEDCVSVNDQSEVLILFRTPNPNKLFRSSTISAKIGGDGGGG